MKNLLIVLHMVEGNPRLVGVYADTDAALVGKAEHIWRFAIEAEAEDGGDRDEDEPFHEKLNQMGALERHFELRYEILVAEGITSVS
jgi:hypothetical protein